MSSGSGESAEFVYPRVIAIEIRGVAAGEGELMVVVLVAAVVAAVEKI